MARLAASKDAELRVLRPGPAAPGLLRMSWLVTPDTPLRLRRRLVCWRWTYSSRGRTAAS
jgi:hypothetical protein